MDPLGAMVGLEIYRVFLVFVRVGAAVMFMPGFGEMSVPARVRLGIAAVLALALAPAVPGLPAGTPSNAAVLLHNFSAEMLAGAFIGLGARLFLAALQLAGMLAGQAFGLINPFAMAGTGFEAGSVISGALVVAGITLALAGDLHYLMVAALLRSYTIFPAAQMPDTAALAQDYTVLVAGTFKLGVGLAAPFLVCGLLFNIALGLANRMMPTLPVFFVGAPAMLLIGFTVLAAAAGVMLTGFADGLGTWLSGF